MRACLSPCFVFVDLEARNVLRAHSWRLYFLSGSASTLLRNIALSESIAQRTGSELPCKLVTERRPASPDIARCGRRRVVRRRKASEHHRRMQTSRQKAPRAAAAAAAPTQAPAQRRARQQERQSLELP